jgi:hypothetical protein
MGNVPITHLLYARSRQEYSDSGKSNGTAIRPEQAVQVRARAQRNDKALAMPRSRVG